MIRTCDLLIRSQALYPAELRVRKSEYLDYKSNAFVSSLANHKSQIYLAKSSWRVLEIRSAPVDFVFY